MIKIITACLLINLSALAFASDDHDKAKRLFDTGDILALQVVLEKARNIQAGKIIEVELESSHGKYIYEIELLTPEGKVLELKFDAKTGKHLSTEDED